MDIVISISSTQLWVALTLVVLFVIVLRRFDSLSGLLPSDDKHVLITGCDTGFGNLTAKTLDKFGYTVHACCLTQEGRHNLSKTASSRLRTHLLDVTSEEQLASLVNALRASKVKLWALVNNAGYMAGYFVEYTSLETYQRQMDVNFFGAVRVTKALLPFIQTGGRIVNLCSCCSYWAFPGISSYSATKFALRAFTDTLRVEMLGFGIKVSMIVPGMHTTTNFVDRTMRSLQNELDRAPKDVVERYGSGHGAEAMKIARFLIESQRPIGIGTDPMGVVNSIYRAVGTRCPKKRYIVGMDSYMSLLIASCMPTFLHDRFLYYNGKLVKSIVNRKQSSSASS